MSLSQSEEREVPLRANENSVNLTKLPEARENAGDWVVIGFSFESDWLRKWCEFSGRFIKQSKAKMKQFQSTFDAELEIVLEQFTTERRD